MRIKVDIAGIIEILEFDKDAVIVGAEATCDIVLEYEEIASRHLLISQNESFYRVTQLPSEFKTYVDGRELDVGNNATLKNGALVELGGIFLSIDDIAQKEKDKFHFVVDSKLEFDNTADTDQSIESLLSEASVATPNLNALEEITSDDDDSFDEEQALTDGQGENFRPNLLDGLDVDQKTPTVNTSKPLKKKAESKPTSSKKIPRSSGGARKKQKGGAEARQILLLILLPLLALGSIYLFYEDMIKGKVSKMMDDKPVRASLKVASDIDPKLKKYQDLFQSFVSENNCQDAQLKSICDAFKKMGVKSDDFKIVTNNETLILGFDGDDLDAKINRLITKDSIPDEKLEFTIQQEYRDYFSFSDFKNNNYQPPLKGYIYTKDENKHLIYLMALLFKQKLEYGANVKKIYIFSYLNFMNEIVPEDFLVMNPVAYEREFKFSEIKNLNLKLAWKYSLTENFSRLVSSFADSKNYTFNPSLALLENTKRKEELILSRFSDKKCLSEISLAFCTEIKQRRDFDQREGVLRISDRSYIYIDLDKATKSFSEKEYPEYTNRDKQFTLQLISDKSQEMKKEFQLNNYINSFVDFDYDAEILIADFIATNAALSVINEKDVLELFLIGYTTTNDQKKIQKVISIMPRDIETFIEKDGKSKIPYLIKSKISIFKDFLKSESIQSFQSE